MNEIYHSLDLHFAIELVLFNITILWYNIIRLNWLPYYDFKFFYITIWFSHIEEQKNVTMGITLFILHVIFTINKTCKFSAIF